jgi:hypothetical protein
MSYIKNQLLTTMATWDAAVDGPYPDWLRCLRDESHDKPVQRSASPSCAVLPPPDGGGVGWASAGASEAAAPTNEVAHDCPAHP